MLAEEGRTKCELQVRQVRELGDKHPEYRTLYRERYESALRESGVKPERVGFMKHLTEED